MKRFISTIFFLLLFAVPLQAQWEGPTVALQVGVDSLRILKNLNGTVASGVVAYLDTTGAIDTASFDTPELNRGKIGMGTGVLGEMRVSGIVPANGVTKIGIKYWLGVTGTLTDTIPTATNVWYVEIGECVAAGYILLDPKTFRRRR